MNIKQNISVIACLAFSFQVHAFDFKKALEDLSDLSKEQAKSSATQEKPSKPVTETTQPKNNTKSSSSSNVYKDTLAAFGTPLGATFSKDLFKSVERKREDKKNGTVNYNVVPKVANPNFENYRVRTYSIDNRIHSVYASKNCRGLPKEECSHVVKMIGESLDKKYGKPKKIDKRCGSRDYDFKDRYRIKFKSSCTRSGISSLGLYYNDFKTQHSSKKKWEEVVKKTASGKASSSTGL